MKLGYDRQRTQTSIEDFDSILTSIREPLMMVDAELKVVKANKSFYRTFNISPGDTEGLLIYDVGNGQWNIPRLRELFDVILPEKSTFSDFELEHDFGPIGWKVLHINARRIYRESTKSRMILLAIEDVTTREYYKKTLKKT